MWAFTVNVSAASEDADGYNIQIDVNPGIIDREDGKTLIKKLCHDLIQMIDEAPVDSVEEE